MRVYVLTLLFVVASVYLSGKSKVPVISRLLLLVAFLTMVLVAGLRDWRVGTDTGDYVRYFLRGDSFADALSVGFRTGEYAYQIFEWLVYRVTDQYAGLLLAIALIVVGCYSRAITAYSSNVALSFFIFIAMGFYTFFFNAGRQGISAGICALAIGPLLERNFRKYLVVIILAALFQKTALVMLPLYFLLNRENTLLLNMIYALIGVVAAVSLEKIVEVGAQFDPRYSAYAMAGEGGGLYISAFNVFLALLFLIFKKNIVVDREKYSVFLNMLIFGAIISLISAALQINPSGILRLTLYFTASVIFLWPIVFDNIGNRWLRVLFVFALLVGYTIFFVLTTQRFSNLVPYILNQDLIVF